MPKVRKFDNTKVRRLKLPEGKKQCDWFENLFEGRSLILSLSYRDTRSWSVLFYDKSKPRRKKLGEFPRMKTTDARKAAREFDVDKEVASTKAGTFEEVAKKWFKQHVEGNGLRSAKEIRRHLDRYVLDEWAGERFTEIRRGQVNELLDEIAKRGHSQADAVLATIRSIMTWYESRDEDYTSPIVKGMRRDNRKPDERTRDRVLSDDEIRSVWEACDKVNASFGAIIKLCLLTGQRREKIATMKWADIDDDGVWTISSAAREKGNAVKIKLPHIAIDILDDLPRFALNPFVFAAARSKQRHFNAWSQRKAELDEQLPPDMPAWVIHDLRRTCRTLMARVGILDHIAELTIGHKQKGVAKIYNRHQYEQEKAAALRRVATEIDQILEPKNEIIQFPR